MCKDQVCEACEVFDVSYAHGVSITKKPEFLLLDIVLIVKTFVGKLPPCSR